MKLKSTFAAWGLLAVAVLIAPNALYQVDAQSHGHASRDRVIRHGNASILMNGQTYFLGTWGLYTTNQSSQGYYARIYHRRSGDISYVYFSRRTPGSGISGSYVTYRNGRAMMSGRVVLSNNLNDRIIYGRMQQTHGRDSHGRWIQRQSPVYAIALSVTR